MAYWLAGGPWEKAVDKLAVPSDASQWAVIGISGPLARKLMGEVAPQMALDDTSFPHLSFKDGVVRGETTKEAPTKGNTFLIWRGGELKDFELRLSFKIDHGYIWPTM